MIQESLKNNTNSDILISNIDCFGLIMDNNECLCVVDHEQNETLVAGKNRKENGLNQLNSCRFIFVNRDCSVYMLR